MGKNKKKGGAGAATVAGSVAVDNTTSSDAHTEGARAARALAPLYEAYNLGSRGDLEKRIRRQTGLIPVIANVVVEYCFAMFDSVLMTKSHQSLVLSYYHLERTYRSNNNGWLPVIDPRVHPIRWPLRESTTYQGAHYGCGASQVEHDCIMALQALKEVPLDDRGWELLFRSPADAGSQEIEHASGGAKHTASPTARTRTDGSAATYGLGGSSASDGKRINVDGQSELDRFHFCCDGQGETITVIKATNGALMAGYSPISWHSLDFRHDYPPSMADAVAAARAGTTEPNWVCSLHHPGMSNLQYESSYPTPRDLVISPICITDSYHPTLCAWSNTPLISWRCAGATEQNPTPPTTGASVSGPRFGRYLSTDLIDRTGETTQHIRVVNPNKHAPRVLNPDGSEKKLPPVEIWLGGRGDEFGIEVIEVFGRPKGFRRDAPMIKRLPPKRTESGDDSNAGSGGSGGSKGSGWCSVM